jgi:hypothetical protein
MTENLDMKALGLVGGEAEEVQEEQLAQESAETIKAVEEAQEEYLNSPMGRIEQALAALMFHSETFSARIDQLERYVTYLLSKDPSVGDKIKAMAAVTSPVAETTNEQGSKA